MGPEVSRPIRVYIPSVPSLPLQRIEEYVETRWEYDEIDVDQADSLHELLLKIDYDDEVQRHHLNALLTLRQNWRVTAWTEIFLDPANRPRRLHISPFWEPPVSNL